MYKTILSLMLCGVGASFAAESFENSSSGDFESLETSLGTLKALSSSAVIKKYAKTGDQSVCIQGGKNKSLQLDFAKPSEGDQTLVLWAGVPAAKGAAMLKTYVIAPSGEKQLIDIDKKMPAGKVSKKMEFKIPAGSLGLVWVMTSTVKEGLALDDMELKPIEWSYAGASMSHAYAFPIMKKGGINPVVCIKVPNNLDVTSITLKVTPAASVEEVGVAVGSVDATQFAERKHYLSAQPDKEGLVILKNESALPGGNDPLWLSIIPSEKSAVGGEIRISDVRVMSGKDECRSLAASTHRIGTMVAVAGDPVIDPAVRDAKKSKKDEAVAPACSKFFRVPGIVSSRKKGQLAASFDARYSDAAELRNDTDVVVATSKDGGQTWSDVTIAMNTGSGSTHGCGRSSILANSRGELWLQATGCIVENGEATVEGIRDVVEDKDDKAKNKCTTWQWLMTTSSDAGFKWDKELVNPTKAMAEEEKEWKSIASGSGTGIVTSEGVMVYPAIICTGTRTEDFHSALCYSSDGGRRWTMSAPLPEATADCTVAELRDGRLMLNAHDRKLRGKRLVYTTKDMGKSWTEHESSGKALDYLVPQCGLLSLSHKSYGKLLLFVSGTLNQPVDPEDKNPAKKMLIRYSKDDGKTWNKGFVFDVRPSLGGASLTMASTDHVGVLYESPRGVNLNGEDYGISFLKISLKDILSAE